MHFLVVFSIFFACAFAAEVPQENEEQVREKRGIIGAPLPISYSSHYAYHSPPIAVSYAPIAKYVAPIPAVKVVQPLPIAKVVAPAISYTKVAYPGILPHYGFSHDFGHGFGHGFGHFY